MPEKNEILEALNGVFRSAFARDDLDISRETNASHIEGWDSFMHINLIVAIEERFQVSITTEEIGAFMCVGDVVDLLQRKLG